MMLGTEDCKVEKNLLSVQTQQLCSSLVSCAILHSVYIRKEHQLISWSWLLN